MKSLQDHIDYLDDENKRLLKDLEEITAQREEAEQRNKNSVKEMENVKITLKSEREKSQFLQKTKDRLDGDLASYKTRTNQLEDLVNKYKNELLEMESFKQELERKTNGEIEVLKQKSDGLTRRLDEIMIENNNLQETLNEATSKLSDEDLGEYQTKIAHFEDNIRMKDNEIEKQKDINHKLFEDNNHLHKTIKELETDHSNIKRKYDELRLGEDEMKKLASELSTIKSQYNSELVKNTKLSETISSLKSREVDQNELIVNNQKLNFELMKLEKEIIGIAQDHEKELLQRQQQYEQEKETLNGQYKKEKQSLCKKVTDFERKINLVISKNDSLDKQSKEASTRISKMVPLVNELKKHMDFVVSQDSLNTST